MESSQSVSKMLPSAGESNGHASSSQKVGAGAAAAAAAATATNAAPEPVMMAGSYRERMRKMSRRSRGGGGDGHDSVGRVGLEENDTRPCTDYDVAYFQSYSHLGIHEEMIKDRVRTESYRKAILHHQSLIAGKVVVDVGCGTGILSIFCAHAGAKRVYAIDASDIAVQAKEVVKANNLSETVIVLHGRVEDVQIDEEVDVIVSEWMGYMLLYESMLGSVITARERWLKPGGLILPSTATNIDCDQYKLVILEMFLTVPRVSQDNMHIYDLRVQQLYMAPVSNPDRYSESIEFWQNVYGIDMSAMIPLARQCAFEEPSVETISSENVLTWPHVVKEINCYKISLKELESVTTSFSFKSMMRAPLHGFVFWFDVEFRGAEDSSKCDESHASIGSTTEYGLPKKRKAYPSEALVLSTAPEDPPTHWQQTLIYFYEPVDVEQDQLIEGSVTLSQSKENCRFMNVHLEYTSGGRSLVKESVLR